MTAAEPLTWAGVRRACARLGSADSDGYADVIVRPGDGLGHELVGRLEDAPNAVTAIDLDAPPPWLR